MNDIERLVKLEALKLFSEATKSRIEDLEFFMRVGVYTEDTITAMDNAIRARLIYADEKLEEIMELFMDAY